MFYNNKVHEFKLCVDENQIEDLQKKLDIARFPETETLSNRTVGRERWKQGVPLDDLKELVSYWRSEYNWRSFEKHINDIGQYRTSIDNLGIHFLHCHSKRKDAIPLIMTHGWPGSIVEFAYIIEELANPKDPEVIAFHVVVPSLPGFSYSDKPNTEGWGTEKIAATWVKLMERLGYSKFLAYGGDWGKNITTILGGRFPEHVIGIHTASALGLENVTKEGLTSDEIKWVEDTYNFTNYQTAYAKQQATKPQTIGYSLVDSPVGLLAWLLDKFYEWSDTEDKPFKRIPKDYILDDVMLYWLSKSGASAARIYYESLNSLDPNLRVDVPTAITTYPHDIEKCPYRWAKERYHNIVYWKCPEIGGHFPSLEVPDFFVKDLQEGLKTVLRASNTF